MLKAVFTAGIDEITVPGLTQWDTGQKLEITLSDLPPNFQVHFAQYRRSEIAYVVEATSNNGVATVKIPNKILQADSKSACAWIYIPSDDGHETIKTINLPIQERARPADYVYEEEEILYFEKVMERTESAAQRAEEAQAKAEELAVECKAAQGKIEGFEEYNRNNYSNSLKAKASGEVVRVDDVSPAQHGVAVKVRGKNLIDYTKAKARNDTHSVIINEDENSVIVSSNYYFTIPLVLDAGVSVVFSCESEHYDGYYNFEYADGTLSPHVANDVKITEKPTKNLLIYKSNPEVKENEMVFKNLQLEFGDTATEYEPYIDPSSVKVTRCGKNLIDLSKLCNSFFVENADGSYTFSKGANAGDRFSKKIPFNIPANVEVYISTNIISHNTTHEMLFMIFTHNDGTETYPGVELATGQRMITITKPVTYIQFYLQSAEAEGAHITFENFQIEIGATGSDFEPYKGEEYTPNADGTVDGILSLAPTMTIFTDTPGANIEVEYNQDINVVANDIDSALDAIIAIQNALIGGEA